MVQPVDGDHVRGLSDAPVTVLVYGDYECPYTRALELSLAHLRSLDPNAFRSVYRFFPLSEIHPHAQNAAEAAEAVFALRGADAFWFMHDGLFAHQGQLDESGLERRGEEAGVDAGALRAAIETQRYADRVERDVKSGEANGVDGTPYIFINGESYPGGLDVASLSDALAGKPIRVARAPHRTSALAHRAAPHG
jgi:protein-disulfide isomerase